MATIRTTDIWNVSSITSRPEPSSSKEEDAADMSATDEEDESQMETENVEPTHVEIQHMNNSALHMFKILTWIAALRRW